MASATTLTLNGSQPSHPDTPTPSKETLQTAFDHTVFYLLSLWPALSVAVSNNWGGPDSADKRDWLAGTISTLFDERPDTDVFDVEDVLLQVMADEFDVEVQDESEVKVAEEIVAARRGIVGEGRLEFAEEVRGRWERRGGKGAGIVAGRPGEGDEVVDEEESEDEDEDEDTEMGEAPRLVERKEKEEPEVDEEGFTMVKKKGKR